MFRLTRQNISMSLMAVAGMALVGTLGWLIYSWSVTHFSVRTAGRVVDQLQKRYEDVVYCPVFVFRDASGVEHKIYSSVGSNPPRFPVGSAVSVLYRKSDPADAQIEDRFILWIAPLIFAVYALLGGAVGFILRPRKNEV